MEKIDEEDYANFVVELEGEDSQEFRTLIMEQASDTAEKLTSLDCTLNGITLYIEHDDESQSYTKQAQEVFNYYYDEQTEELYKLFYIQMKLIES